MQHFFPVVKFYNTHWIFFLKRRVKGNLYFSPGKKKRGKVHFFTSQTFLTHSAQAVEKNPLNCLTPSPRWCWPMIGAKLVIHSALLTGRAQLAKFIPAHFFFIQIGVYITKADLLSLDSLRKVSKFCTWHLQLPTKPKVIQILKNEGKLKFYLDSMLI